jgi:hypothetical protein
MDMYFKSLYPENEFSEISEKSCYLTNWAVLELIGLYVHYVEIMFCTRVYGDVQKCDAMQYIKGADTGCRTYTHYDHLDRL